MDLLEFKNITFSYHTTKAEILALKNISFSAKKGEFISIVGPSGCGKTTILSLISGLLKPSQGEILLEGEKVGNFDIGYMFQRDHLFEWRTIQKNIMLGLELNKKTKSNESLQKIKNMIEKYGLSDFVNSYPSQLSGGMRQRVALIRTLALEPKLLLLDEPFSALDYQTKLHVCDDVKAIIKNENQTAISVTHDISEAISMSDRIIILTKRPAEIKKIVEIDIPNCNTPLQRRESKEFSKYFDIVWKELAYAKD